MHQIAIAAKHYNIEACCQLAARYGAGVEIQSFAFPPLLHMDDWTDQVGAYQRWLGNVPGPVSLHGAFMDMAPGSPDPRFKEVTYQRTIQALNTATDLGADTVVFHANFIAPIRDKTYRDGWTERMVTFFGPVAEYAEQLGIQIALENMWEFDPAIIRVVLEGVASPALNACLDVGHAHLFSTLPFRDWLDDLREWIVYIHMNNNYGDIDVHMGLDDGVMDYEAILPQLMQLPHTPRFVLEIEEVDDIQRSLEYLLPHVSSSA